MHFEEHQIFHIYNQGNNKERIFFQQRNYFFFLDKMKDHLLPYVDLLCYCLMPNHFHWLVMTKAEACLPSRAVKPNAPSPSHMMTQSHHMTGGEPGASQYQQKLSSGIAIILRSYTRAINIQEGRSGSLFRSHTKFKNCGEEGLITMGSKRERLMYCPENEYARTCFSYIHQNPVKAMMVKNELSWQFSSARDFAGWRADGICNIDKAKELFF